MLDTLYSNKFSLSLEEFLPAFFSDFFYLANSPPHLVTHTHLLKSC